MNQDFNEDFRNLALQNRDALLSEVDLGVVPDFIWVW